MTMGNVEIKSIPARQHWARVGKATKFSGVPQEPRIRVSPGSQSKTRLLFSTFRDTKCSSIVSTAAKNQK